MYKSAVDYRFPRPPCAPPIPIPFIMFIIAPMSEHTLAADLFEGNDVVTHLASLRLPRQAHPSSTGALTYLVDVSWTRLQKRKIFNVPGIPPPPPPPPSIFIIDAISNKVS